MGVKQAVDQVQIAGSATTGTNGERTSEMSLSAGCKSGGLFVSRMYPFDVTAPAQCVSYPIKAVANDSIDSANTDRMKNVGDEIGNSLRFHRRSPKRTVVQLRCPIIGRPVSVFWPRTAPTETYGDYSRDRRSAERGSEVTLRSSSIQR